MLEVLQMLVVLHTFMQAADYPANHLINTPMSAVRWLFGILAALEHRFYSVSFAALAVQYPLCCWLSGRLVSLQL